MQQDFSKGFFVIMTIVSIVFVYIIFTVLPDKTKTIFIGQGTSMEPTLKDGDEVVVSVTRKPSEGDIVVFLCKSCEEYPDEIMTKRVDEINEPGCYWMLGDNREVSYDSRSFGWLCKEDLELYGVVVDVKNRELPTN